MKRATWIGATLILALVLFSPELVAASPLAYPLSQGRVCPPSRPDSVVGTVKHRKRDASSATGSDRFLVRLADEVDEPDRLIDHVVTAPDGSYKLCFAQSDIISNPEAFVVRAYSAYVPDGASWITVQKTDAAWDGTYFTHLYSMAVGVSISLGQTSVQGPTVQAPTESVEEKAFRIKGDIQIGYDFVGGNVGDNDITDWLEAEWPQNVPGASKSFFCYDPPLGIGCTEPRVYLTQSDGETKRWLVLHEIGHHVMYNRYGD